MSRPRRTSAADRLRAGVKTAADPHAVPKGVGPETFLAGRVPPEICAAVPVMHESDHKAVRAILQAVMQHVVMGDLSEEGLAAAVASLGPSKEAHGEAIFTGLLLLLRAAVRRRTKLSDVTRDLAALHVPDMVARDIVKLLKNSRPELEAGFDRDVPHFPGLADMKWRIDVAMTSSVLSRVFRPSITMQLRLTDGTLRAFDVSLKEFHALRHGVAKVLREMNALETRPIMRITADLEKKRLDSVNS